MIPHTLKLLKDYLRTPAARSAEEFGDEIEQEIAFHLAERTDEYLAAGQSEEQARQSAMSRFGDARKIASDCHAEAIGGLALWHRLHLTMTGLLTLAVIALWWSSTPSVDGPFTALSDLPPGIASMLDNDWTGDIRGEVLDEQGRPVENAHLLVVVKTWPDDSYFQRAYTAMTDRAGQFVIENVHPLDEPYEVQLAAVADHRVLKSTYRGEQQGVFEPVVFQLPPSTGIALQVQASDGVTLANVEVLPQVRVDADGAEHVVYFDSAQPIVQTTDEAGVVELPYFNPGDAATVLIRVPEGEWEPRNITVPASGQTITLKTTFEKDQKNEESS